MIRNQRPATRWAFPWPCKSRELLRVVVSGAWSTSGGQMRVCRQEKVAGRKQTAVHDDEDVDPQAGNRVCAAFRIRFTSNQDG
jgi:hypothetical protein